jgi:hypothetical protein
VEIGWASNQQTSSSSNASTGQQSSTSSGSAQDQGTSGSAQGQNSTSSNSAQGQNSNNNSQNGVKIRGCVRQENGNYAITDPETDTSYSLYGRSDLAQHVGHDVELQGMPTGTSQQTSPNNSGKAGQDAASNPLQVSNIRDIGECSNTQQQHQPRESRNDAQPTLQRLRLFFAMRASREVARPPAILPRHLLLDLPSQTILLYAIGCPDGKSLDHASAVISHFVPARFQTVRYFPWSSLGLSPAGTLIR